MAHKSPTLPEGIRQRCIKAGRAAKAEALAKRGAVPNDGHKAYRIAYNSERASYLYAASPAFRARQLAACAKWRAKQ